MHIIYWLFRYYEQIVDEKKDLTINNKSKTIYLKKLLREYPNTELRIRFINLK